MGSGSSVPHDAVRCSRDLSDFDWGKLFRVFQKVLGVLHKKCPSRDDAFLVSMMLVCCFEEVFDVHIDEAGWLAMRKFVKLHVSSVE